MTPSPGTIDRSARTISALRARTPASGGGMTIDIVRTSPDADSSRRRWLLGLENENSCSSEEKVPVWHIPLDVKILSSDELLASRLLADRSEEHTSELQSL